MICRVDAAACCVQLGMGGATPTTAARLQEEDNEAMEYQAVCSVQHVKIGCGVLIAACCAGATESAANCRVEACQLDSTSDAHTCC